MKSGLIERLLLSDEGVTLDFKREQYEFEGASKEAKGELLKDVLAFANTAREDDAYILIGVEEKRGAASEVVGVSVHLDDAKLQQFVNSKTRLPVTFSYRETMHDGLPIGVLHIPRQPRRPIYANANHGKVKKNPRLRSARELYGNRESGRNRSDGRAGDAASDSDGP